MEDYKVEPTEPPSEAPEPFNPWTVGNVDEFLFYCCPECDFKNGTRLEFITHAIANHPKSHSHITHEIKQEVEDNDQWIEEDLGSMDVEDYLEYNVNTKEEGEDDDEYYNESSEKVGTESLKVNVDSKYRCEEHDMDFSCRQMLYSHKERYHPDQIRRKGKRSDKSLSIKKEEPEEASEHDQSLSSEPQNCFLCNLDFPDLFLFKVHMRRTHKTDGKYKCDRCDNKVIHHSSYELYLHHMTKEHGVGVYLYKCDKCDKVCKDRRDLKGHSVVHLSEDQREKIVCEQCGRYFKGRHNLNQHLKSFHNEYKIQPKDKLKNCTKCDKEFNESELFEEHLKSCLDTFQQFPCKFCNVTWVSHLSLELHIVEKHEKKMYVCDICGYTSLYLGQVKEHKKAVHQKIKAQFCHICGKQYSKQDKLKEHMLRAHDIGEKKYKCDICGMKFITNQSKKEHFEKVHDTNTIYQCDQCPKTFQVRNYLQTHVRIVHEKYRPHKCDICSESFLYKRDVIRHKKFHHKLA